MAMMIRKYRVDDLEALSDPDTDVEAERTVRLGLDGEEWAVDLSADNVAKLTGFLQPYKLAGRRVKGKSRSRPVADRRRSAAIREWAQARGHHVSQKGRIPASVLAEYEAEEARLVA